MGCYLPWGCLFLVLCIVYSRFPTSSGCIMEERAALMDISSWIMSTKSEVPSSWEHGDDCCSWERIMCDNSTRRILHLDLSQIYQPNAAYGSDGSTSVEVDAPCWNLNMTIFSSFRELQLLDFSGNHACLQNFNGLQGLRKLKYLNLSDNTFIGRIPVSISKLVSLEVINLRGNNMSGPLQNTGFKNLRNLRELYLGSNQLSGSLPASIFALPCLEYLDLSENLFLGHIPINSSWKCPSMLQTIWLSENMLSGKFDFFWLRNCTKLRDIDLSRNTDLVVKVKLHGWVPNFELERLRLSWCTLDKSIIAEPHFLGTQHHLQVLDLSNSNLPGNMPNWLFTNEAALVYLDLSNNSLVGSLDLILQHKTNLQMVNVSLNHIQGQLPANISSMFPKLRIFDISHNMISGFVPSSLCNIRSIEFMDLSNNMFTGEVPSCLFSDCSALRVLKVSNNSLGGMILDGASNLSFVREIYLDNNQFHGTLPRNLSGNVYIMDLHSNKMSGELDTSLWNLPLLEALSLARNDLTGDIGPGICTLTSLLLLDLSDNYFTGRISNCNAPLHLEFLSVSRNSLSGFPSAFFNSSYITVLDLSHNQFTGTIEWTQYLYQIKVLLLSGNKFEGQISSNLCHLQHLSIIDISHNIISGPIPPCIGIIPFEDPDANLYNWPTTPVNFFGGFDGMDFSYSSHYDLQGFTFTTKGNPYIYGRNFFILMSGIDLSANMLSGEIPREIGNLSHIKSLNLSNNFFTGSIPATFANLSQIESLDLSENRLNGSIPWQLTGLSSLEVFSVAYNNLSGCLPDSGQFGAFDVDSYRGNNNLRSCTASSGPVVRNGTVIHVPDDPDPIPYVVSAVSFVLAFWATATFVFCHSFGQRVILKL
ncbi:receptor-like protein 45 [Lolium rigidum]|uniref:receptor-like protein 45 n=1 Tax=Lolium rigidum TaxID=89674 RepID=UPI001F5D359A|nr:receptor-like protein 45 [Lolium rigidum]